MKEVERFIAEAVCGKRYTVSCLQQIRNNTGEPVLPEVKLYRTSNGELLKAIDDSTFNILGSSKVIYRNPLLKSLKFHSHDR